MGIFKGTRPDITPVQIIAFIFAAVPYILVLFGVDLGEQKSDALENLKILALGLFGSDALIRIGQVGQGASQDDHRLGGGPGQPLARFGQGDFARQT